MTREQKKRVLEVQKKMVRERLKEGFLPVAVIYITTDHSQDMKAMYDLMDEDEQSRLVCLWAVEAVHSHLNKEIREMFATHQAETGETANAHTNA